MIKLICTDIDGTLLNRQRKVDAYTIKVFAQLDKSIQVVLASSRMPKALWPIQQNLNIQQMPLICYNGALVLSSGVNFDPEKVLSSVTIAAKSINQMMKIALLYHVHISIFQNNTWLASALDFYTKREITNTRVKPDILLKDISQQELYNFISNGAHKIMIMGKPELIDLIEKSLGTDPALAIWRSKNIYLEITPQANKSKSLKILLKKFPPYIKFKLDEIMAFGDGHNDMELLKDVKYGIAVGNGVEALKEVAYAVTKPNVENGVAYYLNNFFEKHD